MPRFYAFFEKNDLGEYRFTPDASIVKEDRIRNLDPVDYLTLEFDRLGRDRF